MQKLGPKNELRKYKYAPDKGGTGRACQEA
jgi:hypothetical protein